MRLASIYGFTSTIFATELVADVLLRAKYNQLIWYLNIFKPTYSYSFVVNQLLRCRSTYSSMRHY